jgi:hypothetical protein
MPTPPVERAKMDWIPWAIDVLGFPQLDELFPAPADVMAKLNIPAPRDVLLSIRHDVEAKFAPLERRFRR